ncbi:hypothetical protein [Microvirga subterranea]|nr:hypothetical protein [Microvirga subterranea]
MSKPPLRPRNAGNLVHSARLSLKLTEKTVRDTQRTIEESRRLLDRPVYPYPPRRRPDPGKAGR